MNTKKQSNSQVHNSVHHRKQTENQTTTQILKRIATTKIPSEGWYVGLIFFFLLFWKQAISSQLLSLNLGSFWLFHDSHSLVEFGGGIFQNAALSEPRESQERNQ